MREISGDRMKIVIGAIALSIMFFIVALFIGYILVDVKSPSENEHSVPAPKTY